MKGKIGIETSELPLSTKRFNLRIEIAVRQTQTVAWQVNRVNIVMKCFNRYPIPKRDFYF